MPFDCLVYKSQWKYWICTLDLLHNLWLQWVKAIKIKAKALAS
jgi:hypothetical protein